MFENQGFSRRVDRPGEANTVELTVGREGFSVNFMNLREQGSERWKAVRDRISFRQSRKARQQIDRRDLHLAQPRCVRNLTLPQQRTRPEPNRLTLPATTNKFHKMTLEKKHDGVVPQPQRRIKVTKLKGGCVWDG